MKISRFLFVGLFVFILLGVTAHAQQIGEWSFTKEPFINPRIIEDLSTWISDNGDQVVAINLLESQNCNRYFVDSILSRPRDSGFPLVYYNRDRKEGWPNFPDFFGYQYVGQTKNGIYVLHTTDQEGGALRSEEILFLKVEKDKGLDDNAKPKERLLLKKIGEISAYGTNEIEGNLFIQRPQKADEPEKSVIDLSGFN
jgi:hypothetical protein